MSLFKHYLIRHAHRKAFHSNGWGHQISITPQGKEASRHLGNSLANVQIDTIWTSPIKRCIQTAEEIKKGIGKDLPIYTSSLLGDPGFMISNPKIAGKAFQKYQPLELLNLLLQGSSIPGFYSIRAGCTQILKEMTSHGCSDQVWISHDINICILACWIFKLDQGEKMMPEFLEGIEFSFTEGEVFAQFRGLRTKIDETVFRSILDSTKKPASLNK